MLHRFKAAIHLISLFCLLVCSTISCRNAPYAHTPRNSDLSLKKIVQDVLVDTAFKSIGIFLFPTHALDKIKEAKKLLKIVVDSHLTHLEHVEKEKTIDLAKERYRTYAWPLVEATENLDRNLHRLAQARELLSEAFTDHNALKAQHHNTKKQCAQIAASLRSIRNTITSSKEYQAQLQHYNRCYKIFCIVLGTVFFWTFLPRSQ